MWRGLGLGLVMVSVLALGGCARGTVQEALGMGKRAPDEFAVVKRAPLIVPPDFDLRPPDPGAPRPNIGTTSDQARVALTGSRPEPSAAQILGGPPSAEQAIPAATPPDLSGSVQASAMADDLLSAGTRAPTNGAAVGTQASNVGAAPGATSGASASAAGVDGALDGSGETAGELVMVAMAGGNQADPDIRRTIAEENQTLADVESSLFTRIVKWREPSTMGATIDAPAEAQRLRDNKIAGRAPTEGDTPTVINRRQSALQGLLEDIF